MVFKFINQSSSCRGKLLRGAIVKNGSKIRRLRESAGLWKDLELFLCFHLELKSLELVDIIWITSRALGSRSRKR
jgi:hypothetical protein